MGLNYFPISIQTFPYDFATFFVKHGYETFVETGTYTGLNALKASTHFKQVFTIEASRQLYESAAPRFTGVNNVARLLGDSKDVLKEILESGKINKALFWLDAHYSGGETFNGECPLAEEIRIINACCESAIILVDDARFIDGYYVSDRYMDIGKMAELLSNGGERSISRLSDIYIGTPRVYDEYVNEFTKCKSEKEFEVFANLNDTFYQKLLMFILRRLSK